MKPQTIVVHVIFADKLKTGSKLKQIFKREALEEPEMTTRSTHLFGRHFQSEEESEELEMTTLLTQIFGHKLHKTRITTPRDGI